MLKRRFHQAEADQRRLAGQMTTLRARRTYLQQVAMTDGGIHQIVRTVVTALDGDDVIAARDALQTFIDHIDAKPGSH